MGASDGSSLGVVTSSVRDGNEIDRVGVGKEGNDVPDAALEIASPICPLHAAANAMVSTNAPSQIFVLMVGPPTSSSDAVRSPGSAGQQPLVA